MRQSQGPGALRSRPVDPRFSRLRSERTRKVIEMLGRGCSRLEAARATGLDKANVRVIEVRARRLGLLGAEPHVHTLPPRAASPAEVRALREPPAYAAARLALAADPSQTTAGLARRLQLGAGVVARLRREAGIPACPPGRPTAATPAEVSERNRELAARAAAGARHRELAAIYGISHQRVSQILKRVRAGGAPA